VEIPEAPLLEAVPKNYLSWLSLGMRGGRSLQQDLTCGQELLGGITGWRLFSSTDKPAKKPFFVASKRFPASADAPRAKASLIYCEESRGVVS